MQWTDDNSTCFRPTLTPIPDSVRLNVHRNLHFNLMLNSSISKCIFPSVILKFHDFDKTSQKMSFFTNFSRTYFFFFISKTVPGFFHDRVNTAFRVTNQRLKPVFGLWEEAGVPAENPHMHRENVQPPHRNVATGIWRRAFSRWCQSPALPSFHAFSEHDLIGYMCKVVHLPLKR